MKKVLYSIIPVMLLFFYSSCKKDNTKYNSTSSLYVINAAVGAGAVKVNVNGGSGFAYSRVTDLVYAAGASYGGFTGNNTINVVSSTDTTKTIFNRTVNMISINTLYLAGQVPNIDTIYRAETNFPYINASANNPDNSMYVRFVNLSPNSPALNINIKSSAANEFTSLAYKGISDYKKYAAGSTNYIFEIRDASLDPSSTAPLATFTLSGTNTRYKTTTLVIKGLVSTGLTTPNPTPISVFQVNYN